MAFKFYLPSFEEMSSTSEGLKMLEIINNDSFRSALVTGCPGSGKTTVSIFRLMRKISQGKDVRLLTFQKLLVSLIRHLAEGKNVRNVRVMTFHQWQYIITDQFFEKQNRIPSVGEFRSRLKNSGKLGRVFGELIIDEGQDLPSVVYEVVPEFFSPVFVGADDAQKVHNSGASAEEIQTVLGTSYPECKSFSLGRNWRNTYETYAFSRQFFDKTNLEVWRQDILDYLNYGGPNQRGRHGPKPIVATTDTDNDKDQMLKQIIDNEDGSIGVLCAEISEVDKIYKSLKKWCGELSKYHSKMPKDQNNNIMLERCIVTTYKSAKGLEFDTVILPKVNHTRLMRKEVRAELYVACTRARGKLFIFRDENSTATDPIQHFQFATDTYDIAGSQQNDDEF